MNANQQTTSSPVYLSAQTAWQPSTVYGCYRIILSLLLAISYIYLALDPTTSGYNTLFLNFTVAYCTLCIASIIFHRLPLSISSEKISLIDLVIDIIIITLLVHFSQGQGTYLNILLVVSVTASGILLRGHLSTLIAAVATMATLVEQYYSIHNGTREGNWLGAGTIGAVFFTVSVLTQRATKRLKESETYAQKAAKDLFELQKLNHHIIQRMRTGVIVIDNESKIQLANASATELINITGATKEQNLVNICPALFDRLQQWIENPNNMVQPFQSESGNVEIQANFAKLQRSQSEQTIIFLDDASRLAHQAQQLKLASLGQLTAAIAHEIRNPLGAISHAAQLLIESEHLNSEDIKMANIIQNHSIRMNDIIENVLQLSRRNAASMQRIDLKSWCLNFINDFKKTQSKPFVINLDQLQEVWVQIDTSQLSQIMTNLVENGLRYSEKKTGQQSLKIITGYLNYSNFPHLDVIDDGPGIDPQKQERLFEPFFTSEKTGTGLGLYIARELCQMNHANLTFVNQTNKGACFRITFAHPNKMLAT